MDGPTIFIGSTTDDLSGWRNTLTAAFETHYKVNVQEKVEVPITSTILDFVKEQIQNSDFLIHLVGMTYGKDAGGEGAYPDFPAFPKFREFQCSNAQFEYYYARLIGKEVIPFVCSETFPYSNRPPVGQVTESDLFRRLQERHRERLMTGIFNGTPIDYLTKGRLKNEEIQDGEQLMVRVAAALKTIKTWSEGGAGTAEANMPKSLAILKRLARGMGAHSRQHKLLDEVMADNSLAANERWALHWIRRAYFSPYHDQADRFRELAEKLANGATIAFPLDGHCRRDAAIEAIKLAKKRINAVSIAAKDEFMEQGYLQENINAKSRNKKLAIRRIVVLDRVRPAQMEQVRKGISAQRDADIEVLDITRAQLRRITRDPNILSILSRNLLIADGKYMTRSSGEDQGDAVWDSNEIRREEAIFNFVWNGLKAKGVGAAE